MKSNHTTKKKNARIPAAPPVTRRFLTPARMGAFVAVVAAGVVLTRWMNPAESQTVAMEENTTAKRVATLDHEQAQEIRRKMLAAVESKGLAALDMIDESWPEALRRSLHRDMLEHHGVKHPLESLEWLAQHPKIEGSGPLGVELSFSLHARAGVEAGKTESWQDALSRLDRIATHGTSREHFAYLQTALTSMRTKTLLPFSAREINATKLRADVKAVALAGLGDLRSGLDLLQPGGADYPAAHLATQQWLTLGKMPLSFTETANRLLNLAPQHERGAAEVARSLRHPHLDRNIALWLRDQPAGPARDEVLSEIAADISLSDPSFAKAILREPSAR